MSTQQDTLATAPAAEEPQQEETFKDQLDRKATESRSKSPEEKPHPIVEKINEIAPPVAKLLGIEKKEETIEPKEDISGPPNRPDHDDKIEEFVREQHKSKGGDEILAEGQQ